MASSEIELVQGDICAQADVEAVVNAANAELAPGGGVAGAIHRAAGPGLYEECKPLAPISTGEAVITSGHGLSVPWCIHALGPVYGASHDPAGELARCYRSILARAEESGLRSVATPAISTGIFGYPIEEAAEVALATLADRDASVDVVRMVLWSEADLDVHRQVAGRMAG